MLTDEQLLDIGLDIEMVAAGVEHAEAQYNPDALVMLSAARKLLAEVERQRRELDRVQCPSIYAECTRVDRQCVQPRHHETELHFNKAGFAWSDAEAKESLKRAASRPPAAEGSGAND